MIKKMKNILVGLVVVAVAAIVIVWMMLNSTKHIEDTNGPDDYSLVTITDEDIINMDMGSIGAQRETGFNADVGGVHISSGVKFSSKKFTGVEEILYDNYILPSDFVFELTSFTIDSGNFKMVVVHDGKIVATIDPSIDVEYRLENVTGYVSLRIAGESASYSFHMTETFYNDHSHP